MREKISAAQAPAVELGSDEPEELGLLPTLLTVTRIHRILITYRLAEINIVTGQDQLLNLLHIQVPISIGEAAKALNVRGTTVSKMIDKLGERGLLTREAEESDGRRVMLRLTPSGQEKRVEIRAVWASHQEDLLRDNPTIGSGENIERLEALDALLKKKLTRLR